MPSPSSASAPPVEKFYNANGFSGHGFMVAPSWVCSWRSLSPLARPPSTSSKLDMGRFARGELGV